MAQIRDIRKRTALYERLSKDDEQQGESNSILNQKQYLEEYAHRNGFVLNLLYGICGSIGMILAGLGGFAAFLALLDGSYAQAAASALVALLLCPFAAPMLLSLAGSALIVAASALFAWLF